MAITTDHFDHAEPADHAEPVAETAAPEASPAAVAAPAAPDVERKPVEEWKRLRIGGALWWLHDAARVHNGWAEIGTLLSRDEYLAGLKAAGDTQMK